MKPINGRQLNQDAAFSTDVCIVGAGAAGLAIAQAFLNQGTRVLVVESGGYTRREKTQELSDFHSVGFPQRLANEFGLEARLRCVGGNTNIWGGRCARLSRIDFEYRDWIPNSGWPITYSEVLPFYEQAERFLELPTAILSTPINNHRWTSRQSNLELNQFGFRGKPINLKESCAVKLNRSANVQIITHSNAVEICSNSKTSSISSIRFRTLNHVSFRVKAKSFVLACGGFENARLLLMSHRNNGYAIGNEYDNVGRYLMDHPILDNGTIKRTKKATRTPANLLCPVRSQNGFGKLGVALNSRTQKKFGLPNHYFDLKPDFVACLNGLPYARRDLAKLLSLKSAFSKERLVGLSQGFEFLMAQNFRTPFSTQIKVVNHLEQIPNRQSRLRLGRELDELGLPKLVTDLQFTMQDRESIINFHRAIAPQIAKLGYHFETDPRKVQLDENARDGFHHMGATRMSAHPKNGVVDSNCRVFGTSNLFVAGSSVFPTGGSVNPTLTIVALALRLGSHLKRLHETRSFCRSDNRMRKDSLLKTFKQNCAVQP